MPRDHGEPHRDTDRLVQTLGTFDEKSPRARRQSAISEMERAFARIEHDADRRPAPRLVLGRLPFQTGFEELEHPDMTFHLVLFVASTLLIILLVIPVSVHRHFFGQD